MQANINVAPPYSVYLSHYTSPGQEKVMVSVQLTNPTIPSIDVKFRFTIEGAGIRLTTSPAWTPPPFTLSGGVLVSLPQEIIAEYLKPQHLLTEGVNPVEFYRSGKLPEGFYQFKVEVVEYRRNIVISNIGRAMLWLVLNEPPRIVFPLPEQKVMATNPQMLNFTWIPSGASSPLSSLTTQYEFTLIELVDKGIDPTVAMTTASNASKYVKVTDQTNLFYGPDEMPLTPGKTYAIRVKAFSSDGLDMFKNGGYSEVRTFKFGDACNAPLSFTLKNPKQSQFDISVITDPSNTAWQVRFRESVDTEGQWSELKSEPGTQTKTPKGLKASTKYEVQVKGLCGEIASDYTPSQTITTSPLADANRSCDGNPTPFAADNAPPLGQLKVNDFFLAALFPIKVTEVKSQSGGKFTGSGIATLPLFNVGLAVTFNNIGINDRLQLTSGEVKVVRNEFTMVLIGDDPIKPPVGEENNPVIDSIKPIVNPIITDTIPIPSDYDSIVVVNDSIVIIYPPQGGDPVTVNLGGNSTTLLVPADGNMDNAKIVYDGAAHPYTPGQGGTNGTNGQGGFSGFLANFQPSEQQVYGFDSMQYAPYTGFYNEMRINGKLVKLPWKALEMGKPDQVNLSIKRSNANYPYTNLKVGVMGGAELLPSAGGDTPKRTYNLIGATEGEEAIVATFQDSSKTKYAGGIWTATYKNEPFKLYLVPMPGIEISDAEKQSLQTDINSKIFSQAVVSWTVGTLPGITGVDLGDNGLDWADKAMLSSYNAEMNGVISSFKDWKTDIDPDAYYLFVVPKFSEGGVEGFMPRNRRFGFITKEQVAMRTVAHELGHGAFNLTHTFPEVPQGSTKNLMDYSDGLSLYKPQWDLIHNPEFTTGLWDGMEDGAQISGTLMFADVIAIINKIREANQGQKDELAIQLTTGTGKEDQHFELGGKNYTYLQMIATGFNPLTETQPTVTVQSGAGSATINTERPSYNIKPTEYSKTTFTESNIKFVKYVFHELQTQQNGAPYADTKVPTGTTRIEINVKENESINFEEYLYAAEEVLIEGVQWISQTDTTFKGETCWANNWCCCTASKHILSQFGVTPVNRTCIAELSSPNNFSSVTPNDYFEAGLTVLQTYIKPKDKGGEPILIGVHYPKPEKPKYTNYCTATFHYMIVVGKGYDPLKNQDYYRFYDVGRGNEFDGKNPQNRLYIDKKNRTISCTYRDMIYTITEILSNH